ncbi:UDP-glucose 4-epimerase family protein [Vibrio antiquarius]|uniref:UDP-glucose 4-epimerase family protein n=1 Tax=Vibrio antiquarius (strain Ex25) TaxID=150340 RepID=UPI002658327B|nr:SDR family oxidoreductase [Vibrio antiquarius]MCR9988029.1 SDR family oxidoreductase [Vibrio antiquarius]
MTTNSKVLLTGGTGLVGGTLLEKLPMTTNVVGRSQPSRACRFFKGDLVDNPDYFEALSDVDVVVHCAARVHVMRDESDEPLEEFRKVNTVATLNLARQASIFGVKRFIFVSSIKVNGESTNIGNPFTAVSPRAPKDWYGASKAEAEELLLKFGHDVGMEVVIIRPTLVYGPGAKANFASLMNLVSKGTPLPFGCITNNKRSLVSVDNLVDLIITCIDHPNAANQVFLVSDDHDLSTSEMVRHMAKALGKPTWQLPVPVWCYKLAGKVFNKVDVVDRLTGSLQIDISHTKETLDWVPPQSLQEGFKQTAEAFLQSKKSSGKA